MTLLRTFCLVVALVATSTTASAQIIPSFGIAGGLNFGSLSDAPDLLETSTGYHIGLYAQIGAASFAVRPGLFYNRTGELELPSTEAGDVFEEIAVTYVSIPIDLLYKPLPTPLIKPYVLAGPEFRISAGDLADAVFTDGVTTEDAKSFTTALNIGVGAQFGAIIGPKVFGELRYAFDLTGISEGDDTVKVNVVMLRVGVGI